jgi:predicted transcriptional regulator
MINTIRHRDHMAIIHDISESVIILRGMEGEGGAIKTKIMYSTYPHHDQLNDCLDILTSSLLSYHPLRYAFKITDKGLRFLEIYSEMKNLIGKAEEEAEEDEERNGSNSNNNF